MLPVSKGDGLPHRIIGKHPVPGAAGVQVLHTAPQGRPDLPVPLQGLTQEGKGLGERRPPLQIQEKGLSGQALGVKQEPPAVHRVQGHRQHVVRPVLGRQGGVHLEEPSPLVRRRPPAVRLRPAVRPAHKDRQRSVPGQRVRQTHRPVLPGGGLEEVGPGPGLLLEGGVPPRRHAGQPHLLLAPRVLQGEGQPVQAVPSGGPLPLRPQHHIAADAEGVGVVPHQAGALRPQAGPADGPGGLLRVGKGIAGRPLRGDHLKPQPQVPLPQLGQPDMQGRKFPARLGKGLEGDGPVPQQLPHVPAPVPLDHADLGQHRPPGGDRLGQLEGNLLPGLQPLPLQPLRGLRPQLHGASGRGGGPPGDPRQLQ